jgi:hypothetical protein
VPVGEFSDLGEPSWSVGGMLDWSIFSWSDSPVGDLPEPSWPVGGFHPTMKPLPNLLCRRCFGHSR